MSAFEIITQLENGTIVTRRVDAETWLEAWHRCNDVRADDDTARVSVRSLGEVVDVEIQCDGRLYHVRSIGPRLDAADPISVHMEDTLQEGGAEGLSSLLRRTRRAVADTGPNPRVATQEYDAPTDREPARPAAAREKRPRTTQEHYAIEPPEAAVTPTVASGIGDPSSRGGRRPALGTSDPSALPQLFTPMAAFGAAGDHGPGRERAGLLQWGVNTVWQQVPARVVLCLQVIGRELVVSHARGEAERSYRGCRAVVSQWPTVVDLRSPSRMRFGPDSIALWFRGLDDMRYPLEMQSAMWTPIGPGLGGPIGQPGVREGGVVLLVVDSGRASGFTEGELSALCYLNRVIAPRLS